MLTIAMILQNVNQEPGANVDQLSVERCARTEALTPKEIAGGGRNEAVVTVRSFVLNVKSVLTNCSAYLLNSPPQ